MIYIFLNFIFKNNKEFKINLFLRNIKTIFYKFKLKYLILNRFFIKIFDELILIL
jgi:hypothetical protein